MIRKVFDNFETGTTIINYNRTTTRSYIVQRNGTIQIVMWFIYFLKVRHINYLNVLATERQYDGRYIMQRIKLARHHSLKPPFIKEGLSF